MRLTLKLAFLAAIVGLAAAALLPPLFARGQLDGYARDAAQKGSSVLMTEGGPAAESLAYQAAATHPGVHVERVYSQNGTVFITLSQDVHTFAHTFHIVSTEGSQYGQ